MKFAPGPRQDRATPSELIGLETAASELLTVSVAPPVTVKTVWLVTFADVADE
jgi:hypothetical protein